MEPQHKHKHAGPAKQQQQQQQQQETGGGDPGPLGSPATEGGLGAYTSLGGGGDPALLRPV